MTRYVLAIDQGTTSTRAVVFDETLRPVTTAQAEFRQYFPASGHVEHDAEEIWATVFATCKAAIAKAGIEAGAIAAIGITNQRETVVLWDRETGKPLFQPKLSIESKCVILYRSVVGGIIMCIMSSLSTTVL